MKILLIFLLFLNLNAFAQNQQNQEVSPNEDLMREHGILNRLLLIYEEIGRRIDNFQDFPIQALQDAAKIVKDFVENYHEKLEEDFIFPKFGDDQEVAILKEQHNSGRRLTDYILAHANPEALSNDIQRLITGSYLKLYVRMFRPHEAREDTVIFPEFRKLINEEEYKKLGDIFEEKEHELFGSKGFEDIVKKVEKIEKQLNIYRLSQFTPIINNS